MVGKGYQFPELTPEMHEELAEWYRTHNKGKCFRQKYHGVMEGNVSFDIIPTSIGNFINVKCSCGAVLN